jgi:hypothetical protein
MLPTNPALFLKILFERPLNLHLADLALDGDCRVKGPLEMSDHLASLLKTEQSEKSTFAAQTGLSKELCTKKAILVLSSKENAAQQYRINHPTRDNTSSISCTRSQQFVGGDRNH